MAGKAAAADSILRRCCASLCLPTEDVSSDEEEDEEGGSGSGSEEEEEEEDGSEGELQGGSGSEEEAGSEEEGSEEADSSEESEEEEEPQPRPGRKQQQAAAASAEQQTQSKPAAAAPAAARAPLPAGVSPDLPYTPPLPASYDAFAELAAGRGAADLGELVRRIRVVHAAALSAHSRKGLQLLYGILVQHFASLAGGRELPLAHLDALVPHLVELTPQVGGLVRTQHWSLAQPCVPVPGRPADHSASPPASLSALLCAGAVLRRHAGACSAAAHAGSAGRVPA